MIVKLKSPSMEAVSSLMNAQTSLKNKTERQFRELIQRYYKTKEYSFKELVNHLEEGDEVCGLADLTQKEIDYINKNFTLAMVGLRGKIY